MLQEIQSKSARFSRLISGRNFSESTWNYGQSGLPGRDKYVTYCGFNMNYNPQVREMRWRQATILFNGLANILFNGLANILFNGLANIIHLQLGNNLTIFLPGL